MNGDMRQSRAPTAAVEELGAQIGRLVFAREERDEQIMEMDRAWQVLTAALEDMGVDWQQLLVSGPPESAEDAPDEPEGAEVTTDIFNPDDGVQSTLTGVED